MKRHTAQHIDYLNEVWPDGFVIITRTIRGWASPIRGPLTGHNVAHFLATRYHKNILGVHHIWRAVADIADYEIDIMSRKPENLVAALMGFDDNLR